MSKIEVFLPAMGEGIVEAIITKIIVQEGDFVKEDDSLMEIATDKVDSEIPAPQSGIVEKLLFKEGETPQIGDIIAIMSTTDVVKKEVVDKSEKVTSQANTPEESRLFVKADRSDKNLLPESEILSYKTPLGKILSPLVRTIAQKENILMNELEKIQGTGLGNRITKNDLLNYLSNSDTTTNFNPYKKNTISDEKIIEMDRMRSIIADNMVKSKRVSPHVTSFTEADMTEIVLWRNKVKDKILKEKNIRLTFTPIVVEAVAKALRQFPMINVSVRDKKIVVKQNINIGIATLLPNNNLIVPILKSAEKKSLLELSKMVNYYANKARENKLRIDEITGGTFTISNVGTTGNLAGIPIINQPECAILAIGVIKKQPAVIETPQGDSIGVRHIMMMTLTYDHRVIDGGLGGVFLEAIANNLGTFDGKREI